MLYKYRAKKEQGFTLTELIVVLLLIGIVAAITVPSLVNQSRNSKDSQVKSDIEHANTIIETWIIKHPSKKIPSGTIRKDTAEGSSTIIDPILINNGLKGFKASNGTTLTIKGDTTNIGTYEITGKNDLGKKASSPEGLTYNSKEKKYK